MSVEGQASVKGSIQSQLHLRGAIKKVVNDKTDKRTLMRSFNKLTLPCDSVQTKAELNNTEKGAKWRE